LVVTGIVSSRRFRTDPPTWYRFDPEESERRREYAEVLPRWTGRSDRDEHHWNHEYRGESRSPIDEYQRSSAEFDATDDRDEELRRGQCEALEKLDRLLVREELAHTGTQQQACNTDTKDQSECRRRVARSTIALIVHVY
jgi:hypothetical protein